MNIDDITDFDIDNWLEASDDTTQSPKWLKPGAETTFFEAFRDLVEVCKSNIMEVSSPAELTWSNYQVSNTDVCESLGKQRSALRPKRYPKLAQHMIDTNAMLFALRKREIDKHSQAQGSKNKPELIIENQQLKNEIKKLKSLLHRDFVHMLIKESDSLNIQDKVQKISDLEARNEELERQVARMSNQLRKHFGVIE